MALPLLQVHPGDVLSYQRQMAAAGLLAPPPPPPALQAAMPLQLLHDQAATLHAAALQQALATQVRGRAVRRRQQGLRAAYSWLAAARRVTSIVRSIRARCLRPAAALPQDSTAALLAAAGLRQPFQPLSLNAAPVGQHPGFSPAPGFAPACFGM